MAFVRATFFLGPGFRVISADKRATATPVTPNAIKNRLRPAPSVPMPASFRPAALAEFSLSTVVRAMVELIVSPEAVASLVIVALVVIADSEITE